ncbi:hypothetical protein CEJ83_20525, partial [Acinetobacter baumannii]
RILSQTDVCNMLALPSTCIGNFFPAFPADQYDQQLVVEDENGKHWEFSLRIRRGQYKMPCISKQTWHPFVVEKQAEVGDKVEFSRQTDGATGSEFRYKIRVM